LCTGRPPRIVGVTGSWHLGVLCVERGVEPGDHLLIRMHPDIMAYNLAFLGDSSDGFPVRHRDVRVDRVGAVIAGLASSG
jgi:hypothetical protein